MTKDPWQALAMLTEPRRRDVYDFVAAARGRPVTRDEVSEALGLPRSVAVFHLDKLAAAGLLDVTFSRPPGRRRGPGGGRPSKHYTASQQDLELSVPPRRYDIAARIMVRAIASNRRPYDPATTARAVAREDGHGIGAEFASPGNRTARQTLGAAEQALTACGYAPVREAGAIRLRNCPFHTLVGDAPGLMCEINESFVTGILNGISGDASVTAELSDTPEGDCCVVVSAARPKRPRS